MKNLIGSVFITAAALLIAPQSASASTYESYHCGCTAPAGESCSCTYGYTLGKLATKEFRGYCDDIGGTNSNPDVYVNNRNKNTTCTIEDHTLPYTSRSCTNWSLTSTDSVDIELKCYNQ